ncbi:RNA polymerase, sigma 28 subunit, SigD/FliA/WhiG [Pyrinomonas methylaliphatogenes]|uniref:RNA polymerase, sigma 28 subunit, SigD/FliA/WhiG n=2 Tax=Pyrinomonas methylaliphatogenes TaxID=454194 RepID=A0A0B6WY55_9BACT|nr:RNA polymerase, sigma 28 subunit, SigD/FliA/WhiG [Pyrinomonas methylaliphatogenes]
MRGIGSPRRAAHWIAPKRSMNPDRNALIEEHLAQVKFIAERLAAKLPPSVQADDLIGAGVMGLIDAAEKFDPARGVQFKTYAEMRVRGAMLDHLREMDWAPRPLRQRARQLETVYREIEQAHGRPATEEEVAAALNISLEELHALFAELRALNITDAESREEDGTVRLAPVDATNNPFALYQRQEARQRLAEAIERLPVRERQVIALYYLEELTMKEIGAVLGVTESRVSQIHTQAVLRLRAMLEPVRDAFVST